MLLLEKNRICQCDSCQIGRKLDLPAVRRASIVELETLFFSITTRTFSIDTLLKKNYERCFPSVYIFCVNNVFYFVCFAAGKMRCLIKCVDDVNFCRNVM